MNEQEHEHCWHSTGLKHLTLIPQWAQWCCWCGAVQWESAENMPEVSGETHGDFIVDERRKIFDPTRKQF